MSESSLGGYRILGELGRGAMGVVYHGMDPRIGRAVAIKQIRIEPGATPEQGTLLRHRLVREASAAGKLSHPGIVTVYHLGEEGSDIFIVMEYVAGPTLERALASNSLDLPRRLDILRQAADALDFAHRFGIVHRDVKPGNILLREDGVVKIADFGIAKMTQQIATSENLTRAGSSLGSPAYMSPEQVRAMQVDSRSDQFSLGVIAFQMLTGRMPFSADNAHALMFQIISADPFANLPPGLPSGAAEALAPALAKDPQHRYPTCGAMVQALAAALGLPLHNAPANPIHRPPHTPASKRPVGLLLGLLALLIVAAGTYIWWKGSSSKSSRADAPLVKAAQVGNVDEIKNLLAKGEDINETDDQGVTTLMVIAEGTPYLPNNAPAVSLLIDKGAKIDLEDKRGRTALYRAAAGGKADAVRLLLAKRADPNHKDADGSTPLLQAIHYGHSAVLPILIGAGAQVELADSHGTRPLMLAAEGTPYVANNAPLVTTLLANGAVVEAQDERGRTALYRAAAEGKEQAMRLLLEKKANTDQQATDGSTALLAAVTYGKVGAARLLVEGRANVEQADSSGNTPLMVASEGTPYLADNEPLVAILLSGGAKVDVQDQRGRSALNRASAAGKEAAQRLLLDKKANINLKSNDGATPLLEAVTYGKLEAAKLLLARGAGVDIADPNGVTPLMIAAEGTAYMNEPEPFVSLLLSYKARKDLTDSRGRTPLARAEEAKKAAAVGLLKGK
ncbi:MAG: ankyrin repeat domain-containing protein [Acidobacteria bacterium]|nr:ankyrin repeat domain-containing protein [Acidobacteriota bacterium]